MAGISGLDGRQDLFDRAKSICSKILDSDNYESIEELTCGLSAADSYQSGVVLGAMLALHSQEDEPRRNHQPGMN